MRTGKSRAEADAVDARQDLALLPLTGVPVAIKGNIPVAGEPMRNSERGWLANVTANARFAPFAAPWNLAGWPAMVVPAGMHPGGVPMSVQLVTRAGGEARLLSLAAQLEQLRPWPRTAPAHAQSRAEAGLS